MPPNKRVKRPEEILGIQLNRKLNRIRIKVKWKNLDSPDDDSWEDLDVVQNHYSHLMSTGLKSEVRRLQNILDVITDLLIEEEKHEDDGDDYAEPKNNDSDEEMITSVLSDESLEGYVPTPGSSRKRYVKQEASRSDGSESAPKRRKRIRKHTPPENGELEKETISLEGSEDYEPYIPEMSLKNTGPFPLTINCKGCGQQFGSYTPVSSKPDKIFHEPDYFRHCTSCPDFRKLGLMRKCDECKLLFLSVPYASNHYVKNHRNEKDIPAKPKWMTSTIYKRSVGGIPNCHVSCEGCGQKFEARTTLKGALYRKSVEYYVHCIEKCEEYKKLDKICQCPSCKCLFINQLALFGHICDADDDN